MSRPAMLFGLLLFLLAASAHSSEELLAVALEEQDAFKEGDCDKVESLIAKEVSFYANSRRMSREQVVNFCWSIKRPFGAGRAPISDTITPYRIGETHGYTVRDFKWHDENERVVHEVVTKIWSKDEDGWKMIHFQSTVIPEKTKNQQY